MRRLCPLFVVMLSYHCVPAKQLHRVPLTVLTWKYNKYNNQTLTLTVQGKIVDNYNPLYQSEPSNNDDIWVCFLMLKLLRFTPPRKAIGRGHFATVWQGKYQGAVVAVKVFPSGCKHGFTSERNIYELPLMEHSGIARFLGAGKSRDEGKWLIVLELASCVSGQHFTKET